MNMLLHTRVQQMNVLPTHTQKGFSRCMCCPHTQGVQQMNVLLHTRVQQMNVLPTHTQKGFSKGRCCPHTQGAQKLNVPLHTRVQQMNVLPTTISTTHEGPADVCAAQHSSKHGVQQMSTMLHTLGFSKCLCCPPPHQPHPNYKAVPNLNTTTTQPPQYSSILNQPSRTPGTPTLSTSALLASGRWFQTHPSSPDPHL